MRKSMLRVLAAVAALLPTLFAPLHAAPCAGFGDVDSTSPFCANVQWLKNRAITLGCTASTYCPDEAVSRLAMAAFMNRLGTALTPHELRVENEAADLDPDTTPIVCQTGDFLADGFARVAYVDSRFSSTANADVELAAQLVMSADAGASWIDIGPFGSRTSVAAGGRSLLADMGFANLDAGAQARFGVRITRVGAGGDDLAANRCHVRVRVFNRNEPPANQPPVVDAGSDRAIVLPAVANLSASADDDGLPDPPGALTLAWSKVSGPGTVAFGNASSVATTASFSSAGVYVLRLSASDGALDASDDITISVEDAGSLPPPPETVAPPLQAGVVGDIANDTRFLYTGPNPIQTGVAPGAIEPLHAAVLRGRVTDRAGAGLPGAVVSVAQRPELGRTLSRADGRFDLAVSGGRAVTLNYAKDGFLPVQRRVSAPPRDYRTLDDVVLIPLDSKVTPIALGSAATQVHRANSVSDANGTRTATLVVPAATTATLVMPDGSTQPIAALSVRATEYTVGTNGPAAMPAVLPPATGYTYAVELSADEASAAGAASVQFSQPLFNYVDNFLRFPVGMAVPTGYYDRGKGQWIPSPNGRVIRIAAIDQGVATVDSVGTGALPALVLSTAERQQLAQLYTVGKELWRVPIPHFTPWDHNWPYGPPTDATPPQVPDLQRDDLTDNPTCSAGSIVECENQVLGEAIPLVGVKDALHYTSARVPGRIAARTLRIPLSGPTIPGSLKRIELDVQVAGQRHRQSFDGAANLQTSFTWDGKDAYGRDVPGRQPVTVDIGYVYDAAFRSPADFEASFGLPGDAAISGSATRGEITLSRSFVARIGALDARALGLGGWSLTSHHLYDPHDRLLYLGGGGQRSAESLGAVIQSVPRENPIGTPAPFMLIDSLDVGPDGSIFLAGRDGQGFAVVRRVHPGGLTVPFGALPAENARIAAATGPDGSVYVSQSKGSNFNRVTRIAPDGTSSHFAGAGGEGFAGDGGPATQATFNNINDLAVGADGSVYIADTWNRRIRRVGPDGIVATVAGSDVFCDFLPCGDGGPATLAALDGPLAIAVAADGVIHFVDGDFIRRIDVDGTLSTIAGTGEPCGSVVPLPCGDGGPAREAAVRNSGRLALGPDGALYYLERSGAATRLRRIGTDGIINSVAGRDDIERPPFVEGMPVRQAQLEFNVPPDIATTPDGTIYVSAGTPLRKIVATLPALQLTESAIPSGDGSSLYTFNAQGRHLRTLHALTGATLTEFNYDTAGRLASVVEKTGGNDNVTTIERDASGNPTAIVAPFGQRTTLGVDVNGFLSTVTNPAAESVSLASSAGGLLTKLTDARGKSSTFTYDENGRLGRDTDPAGGFQALSRSEAAGGFTVTRSTALGRTTTHTVEASAGAIEHSIVAPDGARATSEQRPDAGIVDATTPDGSQVGLVLAPDARFGMASPIPGTQTFALTGGPTVTVTAAQSVATSNPTDPFGLTSLTTTSTIAGNATTAVYTAATRVEEVTTPAGRKVRRTLDTLGRPVASELVGLSATTVSYDSRGRIATVTRGSGADARVVTFAYDAQGFLQALTDPLGREFAFVRDAAGRVTSRTLPGARVVGFAYDAVGNMASVTPPGRPAHAFGYSDRNELASLTPPAVAGTGPTSLAYDPDRRMTVTSRPDGRTVTWTFDAAGRRVARVFATNGAPTSTDSFSHDAAGRGVSVSASSGVVTTLGFAGPLVTSETFSGTVAGNVAWTYDARLQTATESVNGSSVVAFSYDADGLMTGAGALSIARHPQHGLVTGTTLGVVATSTTYDAFGEVASFAATSSGASIYSAVLTRDKLGRITQKVETIGGATTTFAYAYDAAGQLSSVSRNGGVVESYAYDANGNRTSETVGGAVANATYDAQDRLTAHGAATFGYNAAGELESRTIGGATTGYVYDAAGNLRSVSLPGGTSVTYVVDGLDRRVAKRINGAPMRSFLHAGRQRIAGELDAGGALASRFVYAAGRSTPAYVVKNGVAHRIVADHNGSVRLVVNTVTGAISQRIDYDAFGNVALDTNPGFQPFGFAGGLHDPDTGLVRFGARDYDPRIGRWTAKDPSGFGGSDANLYRYARNDPVNRVDRSGRVPGPMDGGDDLEAIARAFEKAVTKITRALNPETGEPMEATEEFYDRKKALVNARRARNAAANAKHEAAACLQAADQASKRLRVVGPILGLVDVIKVIVEEVTSETGRTQEEQLEALGGAYLGYPIDLGAPNPGII